jgi:general secretion pathway protein D
MESAAKTGVLSMPSGLTMGVIGDSIKIGDVEFPSIGAVVRAYATDSDVQILSTPQVTTMDNEEAEIKVVDNIPFITRRDTTSNSDIAYSNYEFKDVGVILKITPQINQERFVRLAIEQEVSQVVSQDEKSGQPTTLKREAKTTVAIKDGQTVVIGGLIDETDNKTKYRVPVFGKIPLLGWLFKSQTNSLSKKNLYIFLTAHIIENPAEAQAVYEIKKGHIDAIKEGAVKLYQAKRKSKHDRLCDKGYERLKTGDIEEALEYFTKALEANPEGPHALFQSGRIMQDQGNVETAVDFYERLIDTNSSERILESDNPLFVGRKLTDIAEDNLKDLAEHETDR